MRPLISEELQPGDHSVHWDGRDAAGQRCSDGVYFAELRRGNDVQVVRLLVLH